LMKMAKELNSTFSSLEWKECEGDLYGSS